MSKIIECKSPVGEVVGLIDAMISLARVTDKRLDYDALICGESGDELQPIRDALRDLKACKGFTRMIGTGDAKAMEIIHDAAEHFRKTVPQRS